MQQEEPRPLSRGRVNLSVAVDLGDAESMEVIAQNIRKRHGGITGKSGLVRAFVSAVASAHLDFSECVDLRDIREAVSKRLREGAQ